MRAWINKLEVNQSPWKRYLFNKILGQAIPFNKPHGLRILAMSPEYVEVGMPYKKRNTNHLRGIHACAIATAGELAAGLYLLQNFSSDRYRLIMAQMSVDFHYQAKTALRARANCPLEKIHTIQSNLATEEKGLIKMTSHVTDTAENAIASVHTTWQIKNWNSVKNK